MIEQPKNRNMDYPYIECGGRAISYYKYAPHVQEE